MKFFYKGMNSTGDIVKSVIEAANIDEAKAKLKALNILYSELSNRDTSFFGAFTMFSTKNISLTFLSALSRDLAVYLNAGIPLMRALVLLKHQSYSDARKEHFFETLITSISEGKSFAQALESQDHFALPVFYTGTLKISEDRGILAEVLNQLSDYLTLQDKIKKQLKQALIYPAFIVAVSILMVSFMLSVVVPKITLIFESTGQALPLLTQIVISASDFFAHFWLIIVGMVLGATGIFSYKMTSDNKFKTKMHALLLKLPFIGKIVETADLARFCSISSLLMRSGIPVVNTIKLSCITLSSEVIKTLFTEASIKVIEGSSFSKSLRKEYGYKIDESFIEAVGIGEETSELASMLEHLSDFYISANKDKIALFLSVLEPSLMLVIGGFIGVMVTAMLLPIFSLSLG